MTRGGVVGGQQRVAVVGVEGVAVVGWRGGGAIGSEKGGEVWSMGLMRVKMKSVFVVWWEVMMMWLLEVMIHHYHCHFCDDDVVIRSHDSSLSLWLVG